MVKRIYTTKEAAQLLQVTQRTIQLWADSGILEVGKTPGGHRRISSASVQALQQSMSSDLPRIDPGRQGDSGNITVLLVDDDSAFQTLMKITIETWDLPVNLVLVSDGYDALIALGHHKPGMIVTDLKMPRLDGVHMIRIIKQSALLASTRICVVTGLDADEVRAAGGVGNDIEILSKPVDFARLKDILLSCIEQGNTASQSG